MIKTKGFANFFALMLIIAVAIICASVVDGIIKHRLGVRVEVIKWALQSKKVESQETAKVMLCLNEFEMSVKSTKFFELAAIKSQVNVVHQFETYTKDSYLSKEEISKIQSKNICNINMINQSSRQVASKKSK